jgi:hypothetical protein
MADEIVNADVVIGDVLNVTVDNVSETVTVTQTTSQEILNATIVPGTKGDPGEPGADAPSDHTLLTNIGTNTHAQIDTAISNSVSHIANTSNPHIVTKAQVGLSNVPDTDFTADVAANTAKISFDAVSSARLANTSGTNTGDQDLSGYSLTSHNHTGVYAPVLGADDNYVTDAEKVVIGNTSGTNTGDNATNTQYSGLAASKQDADATLTSLAAYNTNGLLTQTAADTFAGRTITGTTNQITVTNGDGVSGNPTLSLPQNIHTGASPSFAQLSINSTVGAATLTSQSANTWSSGINVRKRGTIGDANAAVTSGSEIGYHQFAGWDGSTYKRLAYVIVTADGDTTSSTGGGDYKINLRNAAGVEGNRLILTSSAMSMAVNTQPFTDSTYTLGTSSLYWSNTYTDRLYLNSTAYLDGGTAGAVGITGNVGIGTTTPAHYLDVSKTLNSRTAYGINSTMTASTLQSDVASTGNDETFTNSHYAWKFVASAAHTVGSISVRLKKVGTVTNTTDTIQLKIFSDNAGTPDALLLTTDSIKMGTLTTSYVEYLFGGDMTLVNGTTYWIAVRKSAAVTGGGSIAIDRNGTALTTCNTATPVSGDWTVNAGLGRYTVYGRSPIGIRGSSTNNTGVYGNSTNNTGVYGSSTNNIGVSGNSTNSNGVSGNSTNNTGVYGSSTNNIGVSGNSTNSYGASLTQSGTLTAANSSNAALVRRNGVTNSTGSLNYSGNVLQITDNPTGTGTVSGALISGSLSVAADGSGTTERIRFDPRVANGASAVAHMLDTGNALSTAGALLLDVRNNGVSKHAVDLNGNIIEKVPTTPASATAAGVQGTICWDANYVYVCVATNTWKRSALGSW